MAKKSAKATAKTKKRSETTKNSRDNTPFFVFTILVLLTIIVLLINRFYDGKKSGNFFNFDFNKETFTKESKKDNDRSPEKLGGEKNTANNTLSETEKTEKNSLEDMKKDKEDLKEQGKDKKIEKEVKVYFLKLDEKTEKIYLASVTRKVNGLDILSATLESLIKGPSNFEKNKGYISAVPENLKIRSVTIKKGIAEIDFDKTIEENAAGDILIKRIQQIVYTATQFENIHSVLIKINGQSRKTLGADGFSIGGSLRR